MRSLPRLIRRLSWISVLGFLMCSLVSTAAAAQQPRPAGARGDMVGWAHEELASLQSGELTVWESGSGVRLGWATIQNALKADFPELQVNFRVVDPDEFLADLATAKQNGALPDIVFVENWRQGGPLLLQQRVVEMMGQREVPGGRVVVSDARGSAPGHGYGISAMVGGLAPLAACRGCRARGMTAARPTAGRRPPRCSPWRPWWVEERWIR